MKKQLISAVTGIICIVSAMPCSALAVEEDLSVYAREVWEIANEERAKEGLEPLAFSPELNAVADVRAEELLKLYSHTRPDGSKCATALDEKNLTYGWRGENITSFMNMGSDISGIAMNNWMNSDGHRKNILSENFKGIGVGVSYQDGYYYLVQVFCGDFVHWDLSGETLTIDGGSGVMPNYAPEYRPWQNETENIKEIILADNITETGSYAFYDCDSLEEITFLNPECTINGNNSAIPRNAVICGYDDSTAQEYADKKGYVFRSLGEIPPEPEEVAGDVNNDGKFNIADLVMVRSWLFGSDDLGNWEAVDFNQDNVIDIFDFTIMKKMLISE